MLETTSATDKDTTAIGPNVMSLEVPRNYEEGEVRIETGARCPLHNMHCLGCCLGPVSPKSEVCALEGEHSSKVALSIWLNLRKSFNLVVVCKCLHCGDAGYTERSAFFIEPAPPR